MEVNKIYKINTYLDKVGREIEEMVPIDGEGDTKYLAIIWMPIPSGPTSFAFVRSRAPIKDAKNAADALNKYDGIKNKIEEEMEKEMSKPELIVPDQNMASKIITP